MNTRMLNKGHREMGNKHVKILTMLAVCGLMSFVTGCGKEKGGPGEFKGCADMQGIGMWHANGSDLNFKESCEGTESHCQSEFSFSKPQGNYMLIDIKKTNGQAGCLAQGKHDCQFIQTANDLAFDCGNGVEYYVR